jgi:hypothetical protein
MRWIRNIRFECVPATLVKQCRGARFNHDDWLVWSDWNNRCPNIWNIALYNDEGDCIVAFVYGWWDPMDRELRVTRITAHPYLFRIDGKVLEDALEEIQRYASELKAVMVYWETTAWRAFKRKLGDDVHITNARVLEVA